MEQNKLAIGAYAINDKGQIVNLKYDTNLGGYRVGVTEDQLKGAPKYSNSTDWDWSDRARDREVYDYYKTPLWY